MCIKDCRTSMVSDTFPASKACIMVFTQIPRRTSPANSLSTMTTGLAPPANRDLTPSTISEIGSEDTALYTGQTIVMHRSPTPSSCNSESPPPLEPITESEDEGSLTRAHSNNLCLIPLVGAKTPTNSPASMHRCVRHEQLLRKRRGRSFQRRYDINPYTVPTQVARRRARAKTMLELLLGLDSFTGIGLSPKQFKKLFSRCEDCDRIMTKRSFRNHECFEQDFVASLVYDKEVDIIDLTQDD